MFSVRLSRVRAGCAIAGSLHVSHATFKGYVKCSYARAAEVICSESSFTILLGFHPPCAVEKGLLHLGTHVDELLRRQQVHHRRRAGEQQQETFVLRLEHRAHGRSGVTMEIPDAHAPHTRPYLACRQKELRITLQSKGVVRRERLITFGKKTDTGNRTHSSCI